jgi:serine/threonine protein kinase
MIHMNLAPENIYITPEGKLKIGGLNFALQFSTSDTLNVPLHFDMRINEYAVVPNLRFAAPEISEQSQVSVNSDIYSLGTLIYFMLALNKNKSPNLLSQADITDKQSHIFETS